MRKPIVRQLCLTVLALTCSLFLHAQNVQVSLDVKDARLKDVIESVEGQTRYLFAADDEVDMTQRSTIRVQDAPMCARRLASRHARGPCGSSRS